MSPVFRHGRLRLYLLKLLDEAPRHGYEVIRLLQDRFLGVYAPSPGTIYPRLARLEEEGLVTHDEVDGRKVYRITEKGREELRARYDDVAELEEEITASVRDIAQEVTEDVRATVRSLREELTSAAREMRGYGRPQRPPRSGGVWSEVSEEGTPPEDETRAAAGHGRQQPGAPQATAERDETLREARAEREQARQEAGAERERARQKATAERGHAQEQRQRARGQRDEARAQRGRDQPGADDPGGQGSSAGAGDWGPGTARGQHGWGAWPDWPGWPGRRGPAGHGWADPEAYRDMERLARQFTREFQRAAEQAQAVGEEAVSSLRDILGDTLDRIRTEVFGEPDRGGPAAGGSAAGGPSANAPGESGPGNAQENHPGSDPGQESGGGSAPRPS